MSFKAINNKSEDLEAKYRLPSHITLKCLGDSIHVYAKRNAGFYRNYSYDLELVGIFQNENELKTFSEGV